MKRADQKKLLTTFCNAIRDDLLSNAKKWPEEWDGHDLRELVIEAFTSERTSLMRESPRRRRDVRNAIAVDNLDRRNR